MKNCLCGGTFLTAVFNEMHPRSTISFSILGRTATYSEPSCIESFLRIMNTYHRFYHKPSFSTQTSSYKNCRINGGSDVPFHDPVYVESFDRRLNMEYIAVVYEMQQVTSTYFLFDDPLRADRMVRTLLELIADDSTIPADTPFRCLEDGGFLTKEELIHCDSICIPLFFIGLMEYFTKNVPKNTDGRETLQRWITGRGPQGKPILSPSLGSTITQPISIETTVPQPEPESIDQSALEKLTPDWQSKVKGYLEKLYQKYYLYSDFVKREHMEFESRYVDIDLRKLWRISKDDNIIHCSTFEKIRDYSTKAIIQGHGGSGKSMFMKHTLLDSIKRFPSTGVLPLFAVLRDYNKPWENLLDFLCSVNKTVWEYSPRVLEMQLIKEKSLILLDGFDEITPGLRPQFRRLLDDFLRKFKKAQVIISTRHAKSTLSLDGFLNLEIMQLTLDQAKDLIRKLDYQSPNPELVENFIQDLEKGLYASHGLIARTPLLLILMLISYVANAQYVPARMSALFGLIYRALAYDYDFKNKGGFIREFATGLTPDDMYKVISNFCARACWQHQYDFTSNDVAHYLGEFKEHTLNNDFKNIKTENFMTDLIDNLCLFITASPTLYTFIHSAFQEYFCAAYIANISNTNSYKNVINMLEKSERMEDYTLKLLYEMVPEKVIPHIFIPKLESIIEMCEEEDGCLTYLMTQYDEIFYSEGNIIGEIKTGCNSNILYFILTHNNFHEELNDYFIPDSPYLRVHTEVFRVTDEDGSTYLAEGYDLVCKEDYFVYEGITPKEHPEAYDGNPEMIGGVYYIQTNLLQEEECAPLTEFLTSERSPYYQEYIYLKNYLEELKKTTGNQEDEFPEDFC